MLPDSIICLVLTDIDHKRERERLQEISRRHARYMMFLVEFHVFGLISVFSQCVLRTQTHAQVFAFNEHTIKRKCSHACQQLACVFAKNRERVCPVKGVHVIARQSAKCVWKSSVSQPGKFADLNIFRKKYIFDQFLDHTIPRASFHVLYSSYTFLQALDSYLQR